MVPTELSTYIGTFLDLPDRNAWGQTEQEQARTLDLCHLSPTVYTRSLLRRGLPSSLIGFLPSLVGFLQKAKFLASAHVVVGNTDYLDRFTVCDHDGRVLYGMDRDRRGFLSFVDTNGSIKTFFQRYTDAADQWTVISRGRSWMVDDVFDGGGMLVLTNRTHPRLLAVLHQIVQAL